jgi:peptidoglycan L-alanyl-D-glutamate endopeptidase CwlK
MSALGFYSQRVMNRTERCHGEFTGWAVGRLKGRARCSVEKSFRCIPLDGDRICRACFEKDQVLKRKEVLVSFFTEMEKTIEKLNPVLKDKLLALRAKAAARGIEFVVTSAVRTEAEQMALFAQGRQPLAEVNRLRRVAGLSPLKEPQNRRIVTRVLTSAHLFGLAFDVAVLARNAAGALAPTWDLKADVNHNEIPDYEELGELGESVGLAWGGRFKFRDYGHFEWTGGLSMEDLRLGKRPIGIKPGEAPDAAQ